MQFEDAFFLYCNVINVAKEARDEYPCGPVFNRSNKKISKKKKRRLEYHFTCDDILLRSITV